MDDTVRNIDEDIEDPNLYFMGIAKSLDLQFESSKREWGLPRQWGGRAARPQRPGALRLRPPLSGHMSAPQITPANIAENTRDVPSQELHHDNQTPIWRCGLRNVCVVALWLPLGSLLFCFVTASIFQQDDIHETHCRVYNIIPSISAITGISPQRYLWRICVALHLGPRFLIGSLYHTYHTQRSNLITNLEHRTLAKKLTEACYWLNLVEVCALTGVTYISNRENYPVHEKIFIIFMMSSLLHMWCRAKVGSMGNMGDRPLKGNRTVWILFFISVASTIGLVVFFLRHRLLCRPMSFSWFSLCEYIIACANMAFHATVVLDFPNHQIQVAPFLLNNQKQD
ncbi:post-GPI attachment to proteins factor 2-like [Arctopsyche grandis]|uniref:post-GPI attachment to proteins factor 2-like n=1 Tax=Arctopsyche grandis TaxID=121162 RepID=UPI00406D9B84